MARAGQECAMAETSVPASSTIRGISSMATRQLLAELCAQYTAATGQAVAIEAVPFKGGQTGEYFHKRVLHHIFRLIAVFHVTHAHPQQFRR